MLSNFKLASVIFVGLPLCLTNLAHAQTEAAQMDDADEKIVEKGDVPNVSALPLTITVVPHSAIEAMNPDDASDALKNVAGISSQNAKAAENASISIRGVKLNLFSSYRLNGGLPVAGVITTPKENKEDLKVLKGANALFFGIASPGGVVDLVTKRAGDVDVTRAAFYGTSFGQYGTAFDIGRQFGDEKQFGVRANLSATHVENGIDGGTGRASFGSLATDWRATDKLRFQMDLEQYERHVVEQANITPTLIGANTAKGITGAYAIPRMPDPRLLASGPWDVYTPVTTNVDFRANYDLTNSWGVLAEAGRSTSSRDRIQARLLNYNLITGAATENIVGFHDQEYVNTFGRVELQGKVDTGFLKHELTFGISSSERFFNGPSNTNTINTPQNIFAPIVIAAPVFAATAQTFKPQDPKDIGIYTYDNLQLGADWRALVGLRQTKDTANDVAIPNGPHVIATNTVVTPALGFMYDFAPRTTAYTSYMKGLEDGAQAPQQAVNSFQILAESMSVQKEIGIRSSYFKGISANLAYFNLTQSNASLNPTTNIFGGDGNLNFKGLESTIHIDFNPWWSLDGAGQYLKAAQETVNDKLAYGKSPENIPSVSGNLNITHNLQSVPGLSFSTGANYVGMRFVGTEQQGQVPGFTLFNAGAIYRTKVSGHKAVFQLTVDNLLDKSYWASATATALGAGMVRDIKANVKIDF